MKTFFKDHDANLVRVNVDPGICGFSCLITARKETARIVAIAITESKCQHIQRMSAHLRKITLDELFAPIVKNLAFLSATRSGCHSSCVVPMAVLKAAEAAMKMALPKDVHIHFQKSQTI